MVRSITKHLSILACVIGLAVVLTVSASSPIVSSSKAAQPQRVVLLEQFTGTWCPFCPGSSGALERLEQQVGKDNVIILAYHNAVTGGYDPFDNEGAQARAKFYKINAYPTVVFNGFPPSAGGSADPNEQSIDDQYAHLYELSTRNPSPLQIAVTAMTVMDDPSHYHVDAQAAVTATAPVPAQSKIRFALCEDKIDYRAQNGERHFDWVVRKMPDEAPLTITDLGQQETFARSVVLDPRWKRENLGIIVFAEKDAGRKEVLQATRIHLQ